MGAVHRRLSLRPPQVVGTTDEPASPPAGAEDSVPVVDGAEDPVDGVGQFGFVVVVVGGGAVVVVVDGGGLHDDDGGVPVVLAELGGFEEPGPGCCPLEPGGLCEPGAGRWAPGCFAGGCIAANWAGFTGVDGSGCEPLAYASAQIRTVRT